MFASVGGLPITRVGDPFVNFYLVEEESRLTMVDGGLPAHRAGLDQALGSMGRALSDIEAILITHAHPDHLGIVESVRRGSGADVFVHELDKQVLQTMSHPVPPVAIFKHLRHLFFARYLVSLFVGGIHRVEPVTDDVYAFSGGESLDVPGRPITAHTPGHTPGSSVFGFGESDALLTGDSLVTLSLSGRVGPCLVPAPFTEDVRRGEASRAVIEQLGHRWLLPGHGAVWDRRTDEEAAMDGAHSPPVSRSPEL
ncbi:MAG TPA: MBL fold metallo-hydrolase [Acidimicrobiia bacterium]|nr:MBL fold metallo-hydrolase [Acidimicrobiia bacterium]